MYAIICNRKRKKKPICVVGFAFESGKQFNWTTGDHSIKESLKRNETELMPLFCSFIPSRVNMIYDYLNARYSNICPKQCVRTHLKFLTILFICFFFSFVHLFFSQQVFITFFQKLQFFIENHKLTFYSVI